MIKPMKGYALECINDMPQEGYIAEEKLDGFRVLMYINADGNKLYSRTGKDISDNLPHLRDLKCPTLAGTILDGELTSPRKIFKDMQSICMSLPDYGVHFQETVSGFAIFNVFDIPQYKTTDVSGKTLQERKDLLQEVQFQLWRSEWDYIEFTKYFYGNEINFSELLTEIWDNGGEGLMLKKLDSPYLQKKSKLWLKVKAAKTYDVVICGYQEPTKEYTGSELETWQYWENDLTDLSKDPTPVTKPYAMGWIGAIEFGVYRDNQLIRIGKCADFTEEDLEYIKANKDRLIGTCIEVKANGMIDPEKRSLRHPVFNRFRPDKSPNECTWDSLEE